MTRYDDIWAADARRQAAQLGANRRFPDLTPPRAEHDGPVIRAVALVIRHGLPILALAAFLGLVAVAYFRF